MTTKQRRTLPASPLQGAGLDKAAKAADDRESGAAPGLIHESEPSMLVILLVIVVAIAALLTYAGARPDTFRIERSIRIAAPLLQVAEQIDDFRQWQKWSPWEHIDPTLQRTFSGAETGVGAIYEWTGTGKAGAGRMEITEMRTGSEGALISIRLDFLKPFKASNTAEFLMVPTDAGTDLTWAMFGPSPYVSKVMGVFLDMDKLIGKDFEAGLASLKRNAEEAAR
jgi:hypothetical protein